MPRAERSGIIKLKNGRFRMHCGRCGIGAQRAGETEDEAAKFAKAEGWQQWASESRSPWRWLDPWCVWEVGLPEGALDTVLAMLKTIAAKGEVTHGDGGESGGAGG